MCGAWGWNGSSDSAARAEQIALAAAPAGWIWMGVAFVAFRVFDIAKPWPVGWADEALDGGFGAMADDALAGLYALGVVQALAFFLR